MAREASTSKVRDSTIRNNEAKGNVSYGIWVAGDNNNVTIVGNTVTGGSVIGIYVNDSDNSPITDNKVRGVGTGIQLARSKNNAVTGNDLIENGEGLNLSEASDYTITGNTITGSTQYGVHMVLSTGNNTIANNYFNNSVNIKFDVASVSNDWNISKKLEKNIVGGPYLGGNFYEKPDGTGHSQTCPDDTEDGICDTKYKINGSSTHVDDLPLSDDYCNLCKGVRRLLCEDTAPCKIMKLPDDGPTVKPGPFEKK
jgi:parallel beta-helix repeat protein